MITQIKISELDRKNLLNISCQKSPVLDTDFKGVVINKPWGYEYLMFQGKDISIWMLYIKPGFTTSNHCHPNKKTSLLVLSGEAICSTLNEKFSLKEKDGLVFDNGVFHMTESVSEKGIFLLETETPSDKYDLYRLEDRYHRPKSNYSSKNNVTDKTYNYHYLSLEDKKNSTSNFGKDRFFIREYDNTKRFVEDLRNLEVSIGIVLEGEIKDGYKKIEIGEIFTVNKDIGVSSKTKVLLIYERKNLIKISDYVIDFLKKQGTNQVFMVSGGHIMHLLESVRSQGMNYLCNHHEQASVIAADAYARITGKTGLALVTNGPGATNAITGVGCSWIDSIPLLVISGQANQSIKNTGMRQFGVQEINVIDIVRPITKYAVTVTRPNKIKYHLEKAIYLANSGRPGPVWLEIPLYVQNSMIEERELDTFKPTQVSGDNSELKEQVKQTIELLKQSKRPVILAGNGIRLAHAEKEFLEMVERLSIPVVTSRNGNDLIYEEHLLYAGRPGTFGQRAANLTIQNCDFLLCIGSRVAIAVTGWAYKDFAVAAKKVVVDIDKAELDKPIIKPDLKIKYDAKEFILEMMKQIGEKNDINEWKSKINHWKEKYPTVLPFYKETKESVNTYQFIDVLSQELGDNDIVVTDMGMSFQCTMQAIKLKKDQRLVTASGLAPMGYGLPGAIGAYYGDKKKNVVCVSGDGGLQMNIQELQTLVHYKLPIKLFVFNNKGYSSIRETQTNYFKSFIGCDSDSGVSMPDLIKVADAYGIKTKKIVNQDNLNRDVREVLDYPGAVLCDINISDKQPVIPKQGSFLRPDGISVPRPIEDMIPYVERQEFEKDMIIEPVPFDPYIPGEEIKEDKYDISNSSADSMS